MKKIIISAELDVPFDFDPTRIEHFLKEMGRINKVNIQSVHFADNPPDAESVLVYFDMDEEEPYYLEETNSKYPSQHPLEGEMVELLMQHGVCTHLKGYYPRADRYGIPSWAAGDSQSASTIPAEHGFKVSNAFTSEAIDSQDDGSEHFYATFLIPREYRSQLPSELPVLAKQA